MNGLDWLAVAVFVATAALAWRSDRRARWLPAALSDVAQKVLEHERRLSILEHERREVHQAVSDYAERIGWSKSLEHGRRLAVAAGLEPDTELVHVKEKP